MKEGLKIKAVNVQSLANPLKRLPVLANYFSESATDLFLLSETGLRGEQEHTKWSQECLDLQGHAILTPYNSTAILWNTSQTIKSAPTHVNTIRTSLPNQGHRDRITDAVFQIGQDSVLIVAIYAPVNQADRCAFLDELTRVLSNALIPPGGIIIGGDWNCVLNPLLDSTRVTDRIDPSAAKLSSLVTQLTLCDTYRALHPSGKMASNQATSSSDANRRLDRIYATSQVWSRRILTSGRSQKTVKSTHYPVQTTFETRGTISIGPADFKFNVSLLADPLIGIATARHLTEFIQTRLTQQSPQERWDEIKRELRHQLIGQARRRSRHSGTSIEAQVQSLSLQGHIPNARVLSASVRLRAKIVRTDSLVSGLRKSTEDPVKHDTHEMLRIAQEFYQKLYDAKDFSHPDVNRMLDSLPPDQRITSKAKAAMEQPLSTSDLMDARDKCKKGKAPGPDGLPIEVYQDENIWKVVRAPLLACLRAIPTAGRMSDSQRELRITPIFKKDDRSLMANYRPLNLINADKKIYTQALNTKVSNAVVDIIHSDQVGFIPKRNMGDHIIVIQELFACDTAEGYLAILDFHKAYDSVSHGFLLKVLQRLGFGPTMVAMLRATFTHLRAHVSMNGWLSALVNIDAGVQQGDPLACLLFAIAIEPFAARLRATLQGIKMRLITLKTKLMAADVTAGLADASDANALNDAIILYEKASGARISWKKSFLHPIGNPKDTAMVYLTWKGSIRWTPFRYLGITVGYEVNPNVVWTDLIDRVQRKALRVPIHDIPLALRSRFVNIFAFSIVYFTDKYLPAPPWVIAQLESLALSAIWRNSRRSVSKDRLQAMPLLGGFGMINLERQLEGQRAERFREILFDEDSKPHILEQRAAIKHIIDKATPQVQIPGHFRQQRQWSWRIVAVPHWPYPRFFSTKALTAFKETYIKTLTIFQRAWSKGTVIGCANADLYWNNETRSMSISLSMNWSEEWMPCAKQKSNGSPRMYLRRRPSTTCPAVKPERTLPSCQKVTSAATR